jgi:glycine cleavage system aminomethyltransferase T
LLRTPLRKLHAERGARLMAFAGCEMPVQYPHRHVARSRSGRSG